MDMQKLAVAVRSIGGIIILVALVWWYRFFGGLVEEADANLVEALPCLAIASGECGLAVGLASLIGITAYTPVVFWIGVAVLVAGVVISYSIKKEG